MSNLRNICFHGIGLPMRELEDGERDYWITPDLFHEVLDEVAQRPDVRISFDDGNRSDIDIALEPILNRGMTATFFVLAGRLGQPGSLGADDVARLRENGMRIGTHGMDHRPWRGMDAAMRHRELVEARSLLEDASKGPVNEAALPLGRYDRKVLGALKREGYRAVHTSDRRPARPGAWLQPRYSVLQSDTVESIRAAILKRPNPFERAKAELIGVAKRYR